MRFFIAGPCAIESVDSFVRFADDLVRLFERYPEFRLVYKGSFDKANRTLPGSPRGVGLVDAELAWLRIRQNHPGLMLTTDIHETWQARVVAPLVDVLQIPAFLGKQTDLVREAVDTGAVVNVKKPQWLGPSFFEQARHAGAVWYTLRGTGTHGLMHVDLHELIETLETVPADSAFLDLTHTNRGQTHRSRLMAVAAQAIGFQNFFAETHPCPGLAISDAHQQLTVDQLDFLLESLSDGVPLRW